MKKTIITLLALAGIAGAATNTYDGTWTFDSNQGMSVSGSGVISSIKPNWNVDAATYTFASSITYTQSDALTFSFDATNNGTGNSMLTLALVGSSNAIVVGHGTYDKPGDEVQVGVTSNLTANGYGFATTNPGDDAQLTVTDQQKWSGAMPTSGATTSISGSIAWDGDSFALTLTSSAKDTPFLYDLGLTTLDLSKVVVTIEGGSAFDDDSDDWKTPTMANLRIDGHAIPEPTTATLSLLALAGLAARRRRK